MQTAVDFLVKELHEYYMGRSEFGRDEIIEQANKMFEQQVKDGYDHMRCIGNFENGEQYYTSTYGSNGSDENFKQFSLYKHKETITSADTKVSTSFLENTPTSSQTEISDEEIRNKSMELFRPVSYQECFEEGAKWYREQLKSKGNGEAK